MPLRQGVIRGECPFGTTRFGRLKTLTIGTGVRAKRSAGRQGGLARISGRVTVLALVVTGTVAFAQVDRGPTGEILQAQAAESIIADRAIQPASRSAARSVLVTVQLDSGEKKISTEAESVAGALADVGVVLEPDTVVSHELDTALEPEMVISARTAETSVETVTERVEFSSEEIEDPNLAKGKRITQTAGRDGQTSVTYLVSEVDGVEVARNPVATHAAVEARDEVVRVGTMTLPDASAKVLSPGEAKVLAKSMVAERGWDESQYNCLVSLWNRESGWRVQAANPSSSAYGIPQSLPGSKMASVGADWRTNAKTQITWGLNYVKGRYGSPCGAWSAFQSKGWY